MRKTTLIYKSPKGKVYRIVDPELPVTQEEWQRVVNFQEWLVDLAAKEQVSLSEILFCANEQI
jgi:hypothetical protein